MAENDGVIEVPEQPEKVRDAALASSHPGTRTATGQALENLSGAETERIEGLESRGSTQPIAGGDELKADFPPHEGAQPVGLQAQPAHFVTNGTVDPTMVASPTGLVPVSAVETTVQGAMNRLQAHADARDTANSGTRKVEDLTEEEINRLDGGTLRAIASDQGWDIGENGTRTARRRFLALHKKNFQGEGEGEGTRPSVGSPSSEGSESEV
jgi:hypothetical protein